MNPDDAPRTEPSFPENSKPSGPSQAEPTPLVVGERAGKSASKREKSGGGLLAVLSLIGPVVLGGVTVFGGYFLFLEDYFKKPAPVMRGESFPQPSNKNAESSRPAQSPARQPPQPTFVSPNRSPASEPSKPQPTGANPILQNEREEDAENALKLAKKMRELRPTAAEDWYRRVVERYPETQAAQKARDWLKQRVGEP